MHSTVRQKGAVIVTTALAMLFLLGFMAIALDFGHMFVVKNELQTAMDSCALAAAQELDGSTDAITRATNAGKTAGNLNNVNFQSGTWSAQGKIVDADITFKDSTYGSTAVAANARYAQCQHTQPGIVMWLFQSMGAFAGSTDPAYSSTKSVGALAVATRASGQAICPIPIAVIRMPGGTKLNNYGFQVGEWLTVLGDKSPGSGEMGWYNLDGSTNANETKLEVGEPGRCGSKIGDALRTPGAKQGVAEVWNYRFGLYKNNDPGPSTNHPDLTGYVYTSTNWKPRAVGPPDAYSGTIPPGSHATAANFMTKRSANANYADTGTTIAAGDAITGLNMKGGFKTVATSGIAGQHHQYGYNRRVVLVPVLDAPTVPAYIVDFACVLLLQPMTSPTVDVQVEFRGITADFGNPCFTNGLPGSTAGAGPLVPALVQ